MSVLDLDNGQTLEYRQLGCYPNSQRTWNQPYCNELGRLCQCVGTYPSGTGNRVKGTNTFFIISHEDTPPDRRKEVTYKTFA